MRMYVQCVPIEARPKFKSI